MELLVKKEDLFNKYNIDIESYLGCKNQPNNTTVVNNWLAERQEEIVNYIASFAYAGRSQAERYFNDPRYSEELSHAVLYQCVYIFKSGRTEPSNLAGIMITGRGIEQLSRKDRLEALIAPKAHEHLINCGFLYSGIGRC